MFIVISWKLFILYGLLKDVLGFTIVSPEDYGIIGYYIKFAKKNPMRIKFIIEIDLIQK